MGDPIQTPSLRAQAPAHPGLQVSEAGGALTDVPGFRAAGLACDLRGQGSRERLDLALVSSEQPCAWAATFTRNQCRAAPVRVAEAQRSHGQPLQAVVINSGNANACTGRQGDRDVAATQAHAARLLGVDPEAVFVSSTGRIGRTLPMQRLLGGLDAAVPQLSDSAEAGLAAADAILTSDTRRKCVTMTFEVEGRVLTVSGMAKGAGMIAPEMATMLAFIATDAAVASGDLQPLLNAAVADSFNALSVDGDQSTNDTVLLLANGASGVRLSPAVGGGGWGLFAAAVQHVCEHLAEAIVSDGECITKVVTLTVEGALRSGDAERVARSVGDSLLVKSSWAGEDPNWGRLVASVGACEAPCDPERLELYYLEAGAYAPDAVPVFCRGEVAADAAAAWARIVAAPRFGILIRLNLGRDAYRYRTTDLTPAYVDFNKHE